MSRPSPRSHRRSRAKPGHAQMAVSAAVRDLLAQDHPQSLKIKVFLQAKGLLHGKRLCLVCGQSGQQTRIYLPTEALRPVPDLSGVRCYWLCAGCQRLDPAGEEITAALASTRSRRL